MKTSSGSAQATVIESVDPLMVEEIELDLSRVRGQIIDLSTEPLALAADLLAALSPLHQQVVDVIDLKRVDLQDDCASSHPAMLEVSEGHVIGRPAMLELASQSMVA